MISDFVKTISELVRIKSQIVFPKWDTVLREIGLRLFKRDLRVHSSLSDN